MVIERGTVIAGKYCVERVLGEGGMGVVFAARHLGLDEMVAVKLIREELARGEQVLARFQREARAVARIKSEHVARVLDVDRLPALDGTPGAPYIVMELMEGVDLDALAARGPISVGDAVTYVSQACEGLAEAHALGMVHRDLKLTNLFLTHRRDGRPLIKVIDFGVVKLTNVPAGDPGDPDAAGGPAPLESDSAMLTGTATLVGSIHYMAPEQIRASNVVDARADVWSLGVCLYRMLTGELPFEGRALVDVCAAIQGLPVPDVRKKAPRVPATVAAAVMRALEKDIGRRFADVGELARAIAPYSLDPAGATRVETILEGGAHPRSVPSPVLGRDAEPTISSSLPIGRIESTAAGAATLDSVRRPASSARRPLLTGVLLVVAAAASVAVAQRWSRSFQGVAATPAAQPPGALTTVARIAEPGPVATPLQTTTAMPAPMSTPPAPSAAPAARSPVGATTPRRPLEGSTARKPTSEPTDAYDKF